MSINSQQTQATVTDRPTVGRRTWRCT